MEIKVSLLNTPQVTADGRDLVFPYRKAEGLFYYLCVRGSMTRDEGISIFWADFSEASSRKNLRDALYHLRRLLGEEVLLVEGNNRIILDRSAFSEFDYGELTDDNIVDRYTGEFLGYFYIKNCYEFESWVEDVRAQLLERYRAAVSARIEARAAAGDAAGLLETGRRLLQKKLFEEEYFRKILTALGELSDVRDAEKLYEALAAALAEQLDAEPEAETADLIGRLKSEAAAREEAEAAPEEYFFGRKRETATILENVNSFSRGDQSFSLLLTGEAGVGKTTILTKLESVLERGGYRTFEYQCVQTEEELYLKPWNDLLGQVEKACASASGAPVGSFYEQQADTPLFATKYENYAESLFTALRRTNGGRRTVLFIDNIHWMDKASLRLLMNLIFWSDNKKVLFVLTMREEWREALTDFRSPLVSQGLLKEIPVPRFSLTETEKILAEFQPDLVANAGLVHEIYEKTGGNALFLTELIKELAHGMDPNVMSEKTTGMIQSRLSGLSEAEREMLDFVSLNPRLATAEELEAVSGRPKLENLRYLKTLIDRQLLRGNAALGKTGYSFWHQIIRDYIYNSMMPEKRQALHELMADYYEMEFIRSGRIDLCPMLIYHFQNAGSLHKEYTYRLEYLKAFYTVEHEIYPTVLTNRTTAGNLPKLGGEDELVVFIKKIRTLDMNNPESAKLLMKATFLIGRYDLFSGALEKGLQNVQTSIALAREFGDSKYLMENYQQLAFHAIQIHNLKLLNENLTLCEELLEREPQRFSRADLITVRRLRGVYFMQTFQYDKAQEIFEDLITRTEMVYRDDASYRIGIAACYNYIGECLQARGDLSGALSRYLSAIERCGEDPGVSGTGVFYYNAGYAYYLMDRIDEAETYIRRAKDLLNRRGALWGRSKVYAYSALIRSRKGEAEEAHRDLAEAKRIAQHVGNSMALELVREVEEELAAAGT